MISIVAVTYRSYEDTKQFVDSVLEMTTQSFEFIMGVNGVTDQRLAGYLRGLESKGHVKLVWNPHNTGVRAFNQVMRLATSDHIFRCDSDITIYDPYWTQKMVAQWATSNNEISNVVAVGTANTRGCRIQRTSSTIETDMIMSNCMLIHRPTARQIITKLQERVPEMEREVAARLAKGEGYTGEREDLITTLEYARYHAPWWDLNFGGRNEPLGYGSDDMWWSLLARWAGLKLVTSSARVLHSDASARPEYAAERHRLVARGFQYMRTSLSLIMNEWRQEAWTGLPNNLPVLVNYRESGELLSA